MDRRKRWLGCVVFVMLVLGSARCFGQIEIYGRVLSGNGKAIPLVRVSAAGFADHSVVTLSDGSFIMTMIVPRGTLATFKLEREGFETLTLPKGINPPQPIDFSMKPDYNISAAAANRSLGKTLKVIDKTYRQLDCNTVPCNSNNSGFALHLAEPKDEQSPNTLRFVLTDNNGDHDVGAIPAEALVGMDENDKALLVAYQQLVADDYDRWTGLTAQLLNIGTDGPQRVHLGGQLISTGKEMCAGFDGMLMILQGLNVQLWDHYASIQGVCSRFANARISPAPTGTHP
jgi:hypothetical protein